MMCVMCYQVCYVLSGVLLLEDLLIQTEGDDAAPSRKRRAGPAVLHDTTNWIELAR